MVGALLGLLSRKLKPAPALGNMETRAEEGGQHSLDWVLTPEVAIWFSLTHTVMQGGPLILLVSCLLSILTSNL